jgi:hypothetical protein
MLTVLLSLFCGGTAYAACFEANHWSLEFGEASATHNTVLESQDVNGDIEAVSLNLTAVSSGFTIMAWVKPYNNAQNGYIVGAGNRMGADWQDLYQLGNYSTSTGNYFFSVSEADQTQTEGGTATYTIPGLVVDEWQHIVVTWDNTDRGTGGFRGRAYLNGVEVAITQSGWHPENIQLENVPVNMTIGGMSSGLGGGGFAGRIWQVAMWNTFLTPEDALALYHDETDMGGVNLLENFLYSGNQYSLSASLVHWWQAGGAPEPHLGRDHGPDSIGLSPLLDTADNLDNDHRYRDFPGAPTYTQPPGEYFGICTSSYEGTSPPVFTEACDCDEWSSTPATVEYGNILPGDSIDLYYDYDRTITSDAALCGMKFGTMYDGTVYLYEGYEGHPSLDYIDYEISCSSVEIPVYERPVAECHRCTRAVVCEYAPPDIHQNPLYALPVHDGWEVKLKFSALTSDPNEGDTVFLGTYPAFTPSRWIYWDPGYTCNPDFPMATNTVESTVVVPDEAEGLHWRLCDAGVDGDCLTAENGNTAFVTTFDVGNTYDIIHEGQVVKLGLDVDDTGVTKMTNICSFRFSVWFDGVKWFRSDFYSLLPNTVPILECTIQYPGDPGPPESCQDCEDVMSCVVTATPGNTFTFVDAEEAVLEFTAKADIPHGYARFVGEEGIYTEGEGFWFQGGEVTQRAGDGSCPTYDPAETTEVTNDVIVPVPEPHPLLLLLLGVGCLGGFALIRRKG